MNNGFPAGVGCLPMGRFGADYAPEICAKGWLASPRSGEANGTAASGMAKQRTLQIDSDS
jgi:hypothetical protein